SQYHAVNHSKIGYLNHIWKPIMDCIYPVSGRRCSSDTRAPRSKNIAKGY
ncbi:MAG: hypothetical protein ACI83P_002895, partial [Janthinobacterium sp.]